MKYPRTAVSIACSLIVLATACLSPRTQEIVKAAAPLVVSLSELGEVTGNLPPGTTVAIQNGSAIITRDGSTKEKLMSLKTFGLEQAVKEGALKEGDVLVVDKAGTNLVQILTMAEAIQREADKPLTLPLGESIADPNHPLLPLPDGTKQ